ncbi:MAG TPA: HAMP domain-containing sensor histidine kinase, partial [Patescibacteria group bacterium]
KIIYDFLDFSKIQAGKLEYNNEAIDIDKLVNEVVEDMQSANETHKIIKKGSSSATIEGDRTRLSQVLINLISNAIKYSPEADKVIVEVTDNQKNVIISVHDYGIGIPKDRQRKLFERFYRVSNPKKIKIEGFGLGLYISKEIVIRHGGNIKVDSSPGKGSTFYFNLPIKQKTE